MEDESFVKNSVYLTIGQIEKILKIMKNSVCKILIDNTEGTGFFGEIKLDNNKSIKTLITAYHVFKKIGSSKSFEFYLNNNKDNKYIIKLDKSIIVYKNKKNDIAIIEIKSKDILNNPNICYLEIETNDNDDSSFDSFNGLYKDKFIYIIQYPKGNECIISFGMLDVIMNKNEYSIKHKCTTAKGSSGSHIILLSNSKVIGIHLQGQKDNFFEKKNYNYGKFIFEEIELFKIEYQEREKKLLKEYQTSEINQKKIYKKSHSK